MKTLLLALPLLLVTACDNTTRVGSGKAADSVSPVVLAAQASGGTTTRVRKPVCPLPGQVAVAEICNGFDDNCDGVIDENACSDPCDENW